MEKVTEHSFSLNINVLRIVGIYPLNSYKVLNKVYACTLYIVAMIPVTILSLFRFVFNEDSTNIKSNDFIMVAVVLYTLKLFPCVMKRNKIKSCIHYFDTSYYNVENEKHKKIIEECVYVCQRNTKIYSVGCIVALSGLVGQTLMNLQMLPFNVWLPKFVREKPVHYHSVQFLIILDCVYSGVASGAIDSLMSGLCHQATAQILILKDNLQHLDKSFPMLQDTITAYTRIFLGIKKCIRHHQQIQNFVNEYQNCFSFAIFSQFVGSSLIIGIICFQISKITGAGFLLMVNDLVVASFQIFFYCYYGTLLIQESRSLSDAIYMSCWYEYDIQCKKALIVLMERSKKPMIVTVGKLFDVSLKTFTMILRKAYSFLAILKNY